MKFRKEPAKCSLHCGSIKEVAQKTNSLYLWANAAERALPKTSTSSFGQTTMSLLLWRTKGEKNEDIGSFCCNEAHDKVWNKFRYRLVGWWKACRIFAITFLNFANFWVFCAVDSWCTAFSSINYVKLGRSFQNSMCFRRWMLVLVLVGTKGLCERGPLGKVSQN